MRFAPSAILAVLVACGPGKTTTTEETGVADGSWTGPGGTTNVTGGEGTTGAGSGETGSGTSGTTGVTSTGAGTGCEVGCSSTGATGVTGDLPPAGQACDPWAQDCPEGQKCTFYAEPDGPMWDATACAPLPDDPGAHGQPCTVDLKAGNDTCDKGHVCWDADPDTLEGTCRALCTGALDSPECPPAMHCILARTWSFCESDCHPLMQSCAIGEVCVPVQEDPGHFYCLLDGSGDQGQALDGCTPPSGCDPGLMCGEPQQVSQKCDQAAAGCCTAFCDVGQPDCPDKGQTCVPWFEAEPVPPGFESLGVCAS